jgi:hypothetical protein
MAAVPKNVAAIAVAVLIAAFTAGSPEGLRYA